MTRLLLMLLAVLLASSAAAEKGFAVRELWFQKSASGYSLYANLSAGPPQILQQLMASGYTLQLIFELRFMRTRPWLPDEFLGDITWQPQLSYNALLNRYIFKVGNRIEELDSLEQALARAGRLRAAPADDERLAAIIQMPEVYLRAHYKLKVDDFPQPLQVSLLTNDWPIISGWQRFVTEERGP